MISFHEEEAMVAAGRLPLETRASSRRCCSHGVNGGGGGTATVRVGTSNGEINLQLWGCRSYKFHILDTFASCQ
ncbi:Os02g0215050 [Oryza sativa Japonica Group]|uniref:Os02g0215050 protein n=1 Tax=Oryza sativa subsp. japonica TaxID=39947 RepID=A0A0P0VGM1_ORYSJ|nr:hypothetical protein EE612_009752 [Oryza sativa]BAS77628.1 Os02g0215050 [Oryza sativa Japonica Group]